MRRPARRVPADSRARLGFRRTAYDVAEAAERILATGHRNAECSRQIALDDPLQPERITRMIEAGV